MSVVVDFSGILIASDKIISVLTDALVTFANVEISLREYVMSLVESAVVIILTLAAVDKAIVSAQ